MLTGDVEMAVRLMRARSAELHDPFLDAVADWLDAYAAVSARGYRNAHEELASRAAAAYVAEEVLG